MSSNEPTNAIKGEQLGRVRKRQIGLRQRGQGLLMQYPIIDAGNPLNSTDVEADIDVIGQLIAHLEQKLYVKSDA